MSDNRPTYTEWTAIDLGSGRFNVVKGPPGEYVHAASVQDPLMSHRLVAMLNELEDLRHWRDVEVRRIAAADDRLAEYKREVERRDELLRGAEEDAKALKTENERHVAAWRQILVGKTAEDLDHPLGEFASMAGRFLEIAKSAIRGRSK